MDAHEEDKLRSQQLGAMGRVMAGFTHELKNHLAIINESNGLLADLLEMQRIADENLALRIDKIVKTTQTRLAQAVEMAKHLSGFSHRMDTPLASFQINEMINEELCFLHRFARLKQVKLEIVPGTDLPTIYNNPGLFHFIIFTLFDQALAGLAPHDSMALKTAATEDAVHITLSLKGQEVAATCLGDESIRLEALNLAIQKTRASLEEIKSTTGQLDLVLKIASIIE